MVIIACTLLSALSLFGQTRTKTGPFVVQGQIHNCPEKYLSIFFHNKLGQTLVDTLELDDAGRFYLKTFKLREPQIASIKKNNIQINDIFVAPGYHLTISGDGKDFLSLLKSTTITGIGSESNRYRSILHATYFARMDKTKWYELNESDLLAYLKADEHLRDSIAHVVFDQEPGQDRYLEYFGSLVRLDNKFRNLDFLLYHVNRSQFSYENSIAFVRNNFDGKILDNMYKDEYLASDHYRESLIGSEYLDYLINLDYKKDSTLQKVKGYDFKKVNETYRGKVREYVLFSKMEGQVERSKSFKALNDAKEVSRTYIPGLTIEQYKKSLEAKFAEKEVELLRTQAGKPAPEFALQGSSGQTYGLNDFKGKVIYIDLWASWCGPCRSETPHLKALYEKYKNDSRIAFVSIAVHDGINEWKKALDEDRPEWIQLLDKDNVVGRSYVADAIPKFVLIDKKGNIVSFDAARPSSGSEIEKLLNKAIAE